VKTNKFVLGISIVLLLIGSTGCLSVNSQFRALRNDVKDALNCRLHKETEIRVGSFLIGMARTFVSFDDDEEIAEEILRQVDAVQVGVYKNRSRHFEPDFDALSRIQDNLEEYGWLPIVTKRERDEYTLILSKEDEDNYITKLLVINFDSSELVLAEVKGDLEELAEYAIEQEGLDVVVHHHE